MRGEAFLTRGGDLKNLAYLSGLATCIPRPAFLKCFKPYVPSALGFVITGIFDAPRELVWKAWTDPERLMRWWGPKNFTSPVSKIDLRVGGTYLNCMRSLEGKDFETGLANLKAVAEK